MGGGVPKGRGGREHITKKSFFQRYLFTYHLPLRVLLLPRGGETMQKKTYIEFRLLLPLYYSLNITQLIQCLQWRQVIHIEIENLVTYLAQYGVIELEET